MKAANRINWITKVQSFGILLVVIGHSFPTRNVEEFPPAVAWIQHCIYSFHMPLFMFLSGFLFILTNINRPIDYRRFMLRKVKRLIVPYLSLSTVAYVIKSLLSKYSWRPISPGFTDYAKALIYPTKNPIILFWFLPTLFIIFMLSPVMKKILSKNSIVISSLILVLLAVLHAYNPLHVKLLNLTGVLNYLVYFYLGCFVGRYFKDLLQGLGNRYVLLVLFLCLVISSDFTLRYNLSEYRLLVTFIGIAFSVSLAGFIDGNKLTVFRSFDGYSYQIFLISWFPQISSRIPYQLNIITYYIAVICMLVSGLYVPVIIARLVERRLAGLKVFIGLN